MPGPDGTVEWWDDPLTDAEAVARLQQGFDIVVRGPERRANRNTARALMVAAFGGFEEDTHHAGRMALPHFHPPNRTPEVHAFFESPPRHAKKRKP
jgi:hypothetical protein